MPTDAFTEHYSRWASDIINDVPYDMQPGYVENVCRSLGFIDGVTKVYAYIGGGVHFFDLHFEEMGIAAVNIRIRFSVHDHKVAKVSFPILGDPPPGVHLPTEQREFYSLLGEGKEAIQELINENEFENVPTYKIGRGNPEIRFPQEFLRLVNASGFKDWYTFNGSEEELLELKNHIVDKAKYKRKDAVGIAVFMHHEIPEHRGAKNVHITLDVSSLPERFARKCQLTSQSGGQIVYTDTKLHWGEGILTANSAYNVFQVALCRRHMLQRKVGLGDSSPLAFNHRMAELAREDREADNDGMQRGKFDSVSSALAKTVFCADTGDLTRLLCDGAGDRLHANTVDSFRIFRREVNHFCTEHHQVDTSLHRRYGNRILRPSCVLTKIATSGEACFFELSSARAREMHVVSYLCTGCGVAMLLNKAYTTVDNYAAAEVLEPAVIAVCPWCATHWCEKRPRLKLVEVYRTYIQTVGFEHLEKDRLDEA
jgi:hypothetical protein